MIGGTDIVIPTDGGAQALQACLRTIRTIWPQTVYEDAVGGDRIDDEQKWSDSLSEVFVYRDEHAADSWEELGADAANQNTMIHVLLSPSAVTLVVDDPQESDTNKIVTAIQHGLKLDALRVS